MHRLIGLGLISLLASLLLSASPAAGYQAISVTNGGTIQGNVTFTGPPPSPRKIIPTKDEEVCGGAREQPRILLGPDKAVEGSFVYLESVEKGKAWEKPAKPPVIDNKQCRFVPHVQVVPVGDLAIHNSDPVLHNTHGFFGRRTAFNVALPIQDQTVTKPIKKTGLMRVECDAHGWMQAWIYVADNPYYAVTDTDGSFTITDVPPGQYTLVAWHEHTEGVEMPVTVKAKETATVTIDLAKKEVAGAQSRPSFSLPASDILQLSQGRSKTTSTLAVVTPGTQRTLRTTTAGSSWAAGQWGAVSVMRTSTVPSGDRDALAQPSS